MPTTRRGDFTHKSYLYKVYENGFNHKRKHYITPEMHMNWVQEVTGNPAGDAQIYGETYETYDSGNPYKIRIWGDGDSNVGLDATCTFTTDPIRLANIKTSDLSFKQSYWESGVFANVHDYYVQVFDYKIVFDIDANTVEVFHDVTSLNDDTLSSSYDYIRMYEENDTFYIDNSSDGVTWTNFASRAIDYNTDNVSAGRLALFAFIGAAGPDSASVELEDILWLRHDYGFKEIITNKVINDLEFATQINEAGSSTTITLKQDPVTLSEHITNGAFIDIYANYWGYLAFAQSDTIDDENNLPITDENEQPITGVFTPDLFPEQDSWIRFSGYIDSMELDYDQEEVTLTLVSHGEELSNILALSGEKNTINIITQTTQNSNESLASFNRRQTFTLERTQKISGVALYIKSSSVTDYPILTIGTGATTIATSMIRISTTAAEFSFWFDDDLILDPGTYWIRITNSGGTITWYYQSTNVYTSGSRQTLSGSTWSDTTTDAYFKLLLNNYDTEVNYTSETPPDILADLIDGSTVLETNGVLRRYYSQITAGQIDDIGYLISVLLNLNTVKEAFDRIYEQMTLGWWWSIDPGENEFTMQAPATTPEHVFYVGKDILELKIKKSISEIVNDVYFVGGEINEEQATLTINTQDTNSIANYRRGLSVMSDGRVYRYDTAQAFSDFEISQNNGERITTDITIQAKTYDIETIRVGDLIRIVNLGGTSITLQIAGLNYRPLSVDLSLSNTPTSLLKNLSATSKSLNDQLTLNADNAI